MNKVRPIAFYLPQFFPTPENDEWWEPGFTEWTNVARMTPLFPGHYQPRIPRDLGFYDLRVPETRAKQAQLAREAGIEGFCYWHYWFGGGKRLLHQVFTDVVKSGEPDFPFCLCWANHSWYSKTWDPDLPDKLLVEQTYPGDQDLIDHFNEMLPAFKDKRYMKVNGKLIFGVFDPSKIDIQRMHTVWDELAHEHGLNGFYFFALCIGSPSLKYADPEKHYDSLVLDPLLDSLDAWQRSKSERNMRNSLIASGIPYTVRYDDYVTKTRDIFSRHPHVLPCINPDFDHSPRSGVVAHMLIDSTPEKWAQLCSIASEHVSGLPQQERLVFIKAWNEWGEGNYLEPDRRWGKQYIEATGRVFNNVTQTTQTELQCSSVSGTPLISIVIPLYNKEQYIADTLHSVLSQTFTDYEILVVDDGSTDNSLERAKEIKSDRVRYFSKPNGGPASARNFGIRNAIGRWVMILDADDLLAPDILQHFANLIQAHPDCHFFCGMHHLKKDGELIPYSKKYSEGVLKNNFLAWCTGRFMPVAGSCVILRSLLLQHPFKENLRRYEDAESLFGIMRNARIWTTTFPAMIYNRDSSSASNARLDIVEDFIGHLSLKGKSLWEQYALWRLYREGRRTYPGEMERLYKSTGFKSIKFPLLKLLLEIIYR
jgi:glycosyltransferase involved in cell wall biosynthesis